MAIYSLQIGTVQRSGGQSAVDRAAYCLRTRMVDERRQKTRSHTNTRLAASMIDVGTYLPSGRRVSPERTWNDAEWADRRKNARPARSIIAALPVELSSVEQVQILEEFCGWLRNAYGVATTAALHRDHRHNPHGHIMLTTRTVNEAGEFGSRVRAFDGQSGRETVRRIRAKWADICNAYLIRQGVAPISADSLAAQGIEREPQEHWGVKRHYREIREAGMSRESWDQEVYRAIMDRLGGHRSGGPGSTLVVQGPDIARLGSGSVGPDRGAEGQAGRGSLPRAEDRRAGSSVDANSGTIDRGRDGRGRQPANRDLREVGGSRAASLRAGAPLGDSDAVAMAAAALEEVKRYRRRRRRPRQTMEVNHGH